MSKSYGDTRALKDFSLEIPEGGIMGLLGPNGAGKSTLIRILTQIIEKDSGEIIYKGQTLDHSHIGRFGYLPEERGLYKKMKVGEELIYLARLKGLSSGEATEKAINWVKKLDLKDWWNHKVIDLSKGMQQKIQFIATVVHEPSVLILDEPFSGFDPLNAGVVRDLILELKKSGVTILLSTHRMESVEELCDRIVLINKSKKVLEGDKQQLKDSYKENKFRIRIKGNGIGVLEGIDHQLVEDSGLESEYLIKPRTEQLASSLLKSISEKVDLVAFKEELPSVDQIFKQVVNQSNHG